MPYMLLLSKRGKSIAPCTRLPEIGGASFALCPPPLDEEQGRVLPSPFFLYRALRWYPTSFRKGIGECAALCLPLLERTREPCTLPAASRV